MKRYLFYLLLLFAFATNLLSQDFTNETYALHPRIGGIYNLHLPNFNSFQNAADCGQFKKGSGVGYAFSIAGEKLFWDNYFLGFGVGYKTRNGKLIQNISYPSRDMQTGEVVQVNTENQLQANLSFLEFQPEIRGIISRKVFTRWLGAVRFYIPIQQSFDQKEKIISPDGATFINANDVRTKERALASGNIETISKFGIGLSAGIEALFPNNEDNISFQLLIDYNPMNFTSDANWKYLGFRAEIGYRISFRKKEKPIEPQKPIEKETIVTKEPIEIPKPIEPPSPIITLEKTQPEPFIKISNIQVEGKVETGNELLASIPIVNAVFFQRNSSKLPPEYESVQPISSNFEGDPIQMHYSIFYRIANIIKNNPDATITVEASTSGNKYEPRGITLSSERANTIKNKLISVGVPKQKIKTRVLTDPSVPSNQQFEAGVEENQRVEIILHNAFLQEFVNVQRYANFSGNANFQADAYDFEADTKALIKGNISQDSLIVEKSGSYHLPIFSKITESQTTLNFELYSNLNNQNDTITTEINLNNFPKENIELNLSNFLAILRFDYNSSQLSEDNKELLRQLIQKLPENSTIEILGSADELGTPERNAVLSTERASNTMNFIQSIASDKFKIEAGVNNDKFPENTPQGRFLNRSIKIRVK